MVQQFLFGWKRNIFQRSSIKEEPCVKNEYFIRIMTYVDEIKYISDKRSRYQYFLLFLLSNSVNINKNSVYVSKSLQKIVFFICVKQDRFMHEIPWKDRV